MTHLVGDLQKKKKKSDSSIPRLLEKYGFKEWIKRWIVDKNNK